MGICVGMQVLFSSGDEHGVQTDGLDEWPGVVEKLRAPVLPHMGWNTVETPDDTMLFDSIRDERFYFVHSYAAQQWTLDVQPPFPQPKLTWADHGGRFLAAVENGSLTATQFHPEKSATKPESRLLHNWLKTSDCVSVRRALESDACARRSAIRSFREQLYERVQ